MVKIQRKRRQLFSNRKVKVKLLAIYLFVTILPILLVGIYLINSMRDVVLNNIMDDVAANIDKSEMQLNTVLNRAISISDLIYINKDLKKLVGKKYDNPLQMYNAYREYPIFNDYLKYYEEIENIHFYISERMITNSNLIYADQQIQSEAWYQEAINNKGQITWRYNKSPWTDEYYLTLTRAVYGEEKNDILGVLNINISPSVLTAILKNELYDTYISLDNDVIVHSNRGNLIGEKTLFPGQTVASNKDDVYIYDDQLFDEDVKVYLHSFTPEKTLRNQLQITSIVPIKEAIHDSQGIILKGYAIIAVSLLIALSLLYLFIKSFNKRIYTLRHAMDNVSQGNFELERLDLGTDEIGEVYKDLYTTVESIKKLIQEVYVHKINEEQLKRRQKESEFKMLASQINPHFLYNTLEMIRMKALVNNDDDVAEIVKLLSKMMRFSLEVTEKTVPLSVELELVRTYLTIQKMRFEEGIEFDIDIDCEIEKYDILPLLVQPLVENSIKYGVDDESESSYIRIHLYENQHHLVIEVMDTGVGIPYDKLKEIKRKMQQNEETSSVKGIGLYNIYHRIKMYYGEAYGLEINSNQGTVITLLLPLKKGEDVHV